MLGRLSLNMYLWLSETTCHLNDLFVSLRNNWYNLPGMLAAADRSEEVVHGEVQLEQGALEGGQLHHRLL